MNVEITLVPDAFNRAFHPNRHVPFFGESRDLGSLLIHSEVSEEELRDDVMVARFIHGEDTVYSSTPNANAFGDHLKNFLSLDDTAVWRTLMSKP